MEKNTLDKLTGVLNELSLELEDAKWELTSTDWDDLLEVIEDYIDFVEFMHEQGEYIDHIGTSCLQNLKNKVRDVCSVWSAIVPLDMYIKRIENQSKGSTKK